ncbi:unnamed protein product, partial [Schistocephalus solidus]|uniref:MARVEL domain-containing protein n=1 Tax=Schistocephalus solidus TaxID=70667 RepID=A0A183SDE9_SCHSO
PGYATYPPYPPPPVYRPYSPPGEYQATTGPANDSDDFAASGFDDKTIRRKFISKVNAITTVQLFVTMAFVCVFLFFEQVKYWVQHNIWLYWLSYAVFLVTYITLACCLSILRRVPGNNIALAVFTVNSVLICLIVTAGVTLTVSGRNRMPL